MPRAPRIRGTPRPAFPQSPPFRPPASFSRPLSPERPPFPAALGVPLSRLARLLRHPRPVTCDAPRFFRRCPIVSAILPVFPTASPFVPAVVHAPAVLFLLYLQMQNFLLT